MTSKPIIHSAIDLEEPVTLDFATAFEAIQKGDVIDEFGMMRWGSNYTFLVTITHLDTKFMGVYKPRIGERPLWDFPDGTLCQRETASFVISEMLGWSIVPPTILREGPRGIGSVQAFINHDPNQHYYTFKESDLDYQSIEPHLAKMAAFDAVANNADRKGGHCIIDEDCHLWGIDHGLTFHPANKLRTVIWDYAGKAFPHEIMEDLQDLCTKLDEQQDPYRQQLDELLTRHEMLALQSRVDNLLKMGKYPMPGPGPNRPWPAV
jgi:uncharacterized repeat protein (TIGR03843 family)